MSEKITAPIPPDVQNPLPLAPLAGDYKDDDAQVYEDDFIDADHRPVTHAGLPHPVQELPPTTRIIQRNVTIGTVGGVIADPVLLLPADPRRKNLAIYVDCAAGVSANSTFIIADSKGGVYDLGNGIWPWDSTLERGQWVNAWKEHTGPVWVYSAGSVALRVVGIAVTE